MKTRTVTIHEPEVGDLVEVELHYSGLITRSIGTIIGLPAETSESVRYSVEVAGKIEYLLPNEFELILE